jgi:hypothetical protein
LAIKIVGISIIACSSEIGARETSKDNILGVFKKILAVLGIIWIITFKSSNRYVF